MTVKKGEDRPDVYTGLRQQVLQIKPDQIGIRDTADRPIFGIVMDLGLQGGTATFVCLADGTVSLYTSGGGGLIGAGTHQTVQEAAAGLLDFANLYGSDFINACSPGAQEALPGEGQVHFNLLTARGAHSVRCMEADLAAQADPFANLFIACHHVITKLRQVSEPPGPSIDRNME